METALISLVCVAIIIVGTVTTMLNSFNAASTVAESLKEMEEEAGNIRRTEIDARDNNNTGGGDFYITVDNDGQTNLSQFSKWDVIVQYRGSDDNYYLKYLEYTASDPPGNDRWTVDGIYLPGGGSEVWDIDILNPGENMQLQIDLNPRIDRYSTARITISTPNGVTSQCLATRQ
jgi:hypothetical protein